MKDSYRTAPIDARTRALLDWVVKMTNTPWRAGALDVEELRAYGWSDAAIHDAAQAAAYFNYINRIAGALGCDLEPGMRARTDQCGDR